MHLLTGVLWLEELHSSLFQIFQLVDVFFANLVIHLTLELVLGLQVAWTHPEGLSLELVGHQADQLNSLAQFATPTTRIWVRHLLG